MKESEKFLLIHPTEEDVGRTLSNVLKDRLSGRSWGDVRSAILKRKVQINGNLCLDAARKLTMKDVIKVWRESLPKPVEPTAIKIVHVDDFLVVVEKPPGITSTRHFEERLLSKARRQLQPTLEELLPEALVLHFQSFIKKPATSNRREPMQRKNHETIRQYEHRIKRYAVIAVHRLDRDTSGLMIFARTPTIAESLGRMFRKHEVVRKYHAVVKGHPEAQTFDNILVRDRGDGVRGSKRSEEEDRTEQRAITHIKPIESIGDYSLVECQLETGRTHQIRIHLAEAGFPLCGDPIYCKLPGGERIADTSGAPRQALHSATLEFRHPVGGEVLKFRMPWPSDLYKWLQSLRAQAKNPPK
jgi:23S rRNA pseudouridine1911/1915/1917 synthase